MFIPKLLMLCHPEPMLITSSCPLQRDLPKYMELRLICDASTSLGSITNTNNNY